MRGCVRVWVRVRVRMCEGVVYVRVCEDVWMGMRGWCA